MKKQTQNLKKRFNLNQIPYVQCYEELGMIETVRGTYTRAYQILTSENQKHSISYSLMKKSQLEKLYKLIGAEYSFQFFIRNSRINQNDYFSRVLLREDKTEEINWCIEKYNQVIKDNFDLGHNNCRQDVFLILSTKTDSPEDAAVRFISLNEHIQEVFQKLHGYTVKAMTLEERLDLLYDIYHPDKADFRSEEDKCNRISIKSMKKAKYTTKEIIAPAYYEMNQRDYLRVGNQFIRILFINSFPASIPDTILNDLMSVSSNCILSYSNESLDTQIGFSAAASFVKENTEISKVMLRDTIENRKKRRYAEHRTEKRGDEEAYFYSGALQLFKEATAKDSLTFLSSFIIALSAETLEELDRDTSLLKLAASKYSCQIRSCEMMQNAAFQSVLPLNNINIDVSRTFSLDKILKLNPMNLQKNNCNMTTFQGLNAINDNLILLERNNYYTGMIVGVPYSGKTFTCKREILNALMTTNDEVIVLTQKVQQYRSLIQQVHGSIIEHWMPDFFSVDKNYNLKDSPEIFRRIFLEAFMTAKIGFWKERLLPEEIQEYYEKIEKEAESLCKFDSISEAIQFAKEHVMDVSLFYKAINDVTCQKNKLPDGRLKVFQISDLTQHLIVINDVWNYAIKLKKKNQGIWIYIDSVDEMLFSRTCSDYLFSLLDKTTKLQIPVTLIVDDSVHVITNQDASIEFDYLINKTSYFKLLSLGPIERKKFVEKLNIAESLIPYISDREPGEGIIITPTTNIAFNDRFETHDNEFYRLFH